MFAFLKSKMNRFHEECMEEIQRTQEYGIRESKDNVAKAAKYRIEFFEAIRNGAEFGYQGAKSDLNKIFKTFQMKPIDETDYGYQSSQDRLGTDTVSV